MNKHLTVGAVVYCQTNRSMFPIEVFGVKTNPAKSARNLEAIFDKIVTFHSHMSSLQLMFYHILDQQRIRHYIVLHTAKLCATSLVYSRLD